jgi:hypothetical protein
MEPPQWAAAGEPPPYETVLTAGPPGSIYITDYPIVHQRAQSRAVTRHLQPPLCISFVILCTQQQGT